jgi:hypothetical protein
MLRVRLAEGFPLRRGNNAQFLALRSSNTPSHREDRRRGCEHEENDRFVQGQVMPSPGVVIMGNLVAVVCAAARAPARRRT